MAEGGRKDYQPNTVNALKNIIINNIKIKNININNIEI